MSIVRRVLAEVIFVLGGLFNLAGGLFGIAIWLTYGSFSNPPFIWITASAAALVVGLWVCSGELRRLIAYVRRRRLRNLESVFE